MKAGIAATNWKMPIYRRHLKGYVFEELDLTLDTTLIILEGVKRENVAKIVAKAEAECKAWKP